MTHPSLAEMISRLQKLPAMPAVAMELLSSLADDKTEIDALARRITQPTLVLWGERDQMISPDLGAQFCDDIPRCKLVTFPKLGHLPQEEDPDSTLKALEPFLAS